MISIENVSKSFNGFKALSNLSLNVQKGEIFGLLGANGAGKSTTLNLLLGFMDADNGSICMVDPENKSIIGTNRIGYIPENVNLYPYLSGLENLDYFCKLAGLVSVSYTHLTLPTICSV